MSPILLEFDWLGHPVALHAYSTAMVSAAVVIVLVGVLSAWLRKLPLARSAAFVLIVAVTIPVGARASYWLFTRNDVSDATGLMVTRSGLSGFFLPGGILTAMVLGTLVCRALRLSAWRMFDTVVPALAVGGVVQRIGCFLNGCCFGRETSLPWGVVYPWGSPVHGYQAGQSFSAMLHGPSPVHPTQLYEAAAGVAAAAVAMFLMRRRVTDGVPVLAAGAWFLAFRWFNSKLRAPDLSFPIVAGTAAAIYGACLILAVAVLIWRVRSGEKAGTSKKTTGPTP